MVTFKKNSLLFIFLSLSFIAPAQSYLSIDSAIAITLKNNYNIRISQNTYKQDENNYSPGVAGMLPQVSIGGSIVEADNNIHQEYSSGTTITKNGVRSTSITPAIGLTWTLFDGTKMFIAYHQLGLFKDEGLIGIKMAIQDNVASVIEAYYNIAQQKQLLGVIDSNMTLYKEEMNLAQKQYEIGTGSKLTYLQAKVGYNAQKSLYMKQQANVSSTIVALNQILEQPVESTYLISDSIVTGKSLIYDTLKKNMLAQNPNILLANTNILVSQDSRDEITASRLPSVVLGLNYGLSNSQYSAGFALVNQSVGFNGGLTFSWTIFNGFKTNIQYRNAELTELNAKFQYNQIVIQTNVALLEAYQQYLANIKILQLDEDNFLVAKEAVKIAIDQFRIGSTNIVQLQQAQLSYSQAGSQVVSDRYNTKVSETQLLQLSGQLVK